MQNINNREPQPLGKCGGPCSATLVIDVRRITIVQKPPKGGNPIGELSTQPGEKGRGVASITVGTERRCYNSAIAAQQAAQQLIAERNRRNAEFDFECQKVYRFGPSAVSPDLGLNPKTGQRCPEPPANERSQVGQEKNPDFGKDYGD